MSSEAICKSKADRLIHTCYLHSHTASKFKFEMQVATEQGSTIRNYIYVNAIRPSYLDNEVLSKLWLVIALKPSVRMG